MLRSAHNPLVVDMEPYQHLLQNLSSWSFNIFELEAQSKGHQLLIVAYTGGRGNRESEADRWRDRQTEAGESGLSGVFSSS